MVKKAKLIQIGNSQGLRLPKSMISKYGLGDNIILEELPQGILIHAGTDAKLSWEDTYKAMAQEQDEWVEWQELDIDAEDHL